MKKFNIPFVSRLVVSKFFQLFFSMILVMIFDMILVGIITGLGFLVGAPNFMDSFMSAIVPFALGYVVQVIIVALFLSVLER